MTSTTIAGFVRQTGATVSRITLATLVLSMLTTWSDPVEGSTIMIDDFMTMQQAVATATTPIASSTTSAPEAIGGERDMLVNLTGGFTSLSLNSNPFGGELLIHDSGATVTGYSLTVWDGADMNAGVIDYVGLGGIDLVQSGMNDAFQLAFLSADLAGTVTLTVYDASDATGNTYSAHQLSLPGSIFAPTDIQIAFTDFGLSGSGGPADFSNVGAISLKIQNETSGSLDVLLSSVSVVPEPGCLSGLLIGSLLCFGKLRRRRIS